jgi:membrane peptidoglycan carboxypeptidase
MHSRQQLGLLLIRRHRRLNSQARALTAHSRNAFASAAAILVFALAAGVVLLALAYTNLTTGLPSTAILPSLLDSQNGLLLQPTRFYDRTGQTLIYSLENPGIGRRFLPLDPYNANGLSTILAEVAVADLDPTFWQNPGFDLRSLGSPAPATIAERLVDDLLLDDETPGLRRSLRRQLLASQVVSEYGRQKVLEWYLNSASFGHLAFGADSAARLYLDKPASQLNLAEAALLVGLLPSPALNPLDAPAAAREQQVAVLDRLLALRQISQQQHDQAAQAELALRTAAPDANWPARAFTTLVLNDLSSRFGRTRLEHGGLTVVSSLDIHLQDQLSCSLHAQLNRLEGKADPVTASPDQPGGSACEAARLLPALSEGAGAQPLPPGLRASAILAEPSSGQILAFLGDTTAGTENAQLSSHQPGTLLTPFLAVAAFSRGMSPASLVWDIPPLAAVAPGSSASGTNGGATPASNSAAVYRGPMRLRSALANDRLIPLNQVLLQIGANNVWQLAEPLGLHGLFQTSDPAGLLQAGGQASLVELAQAYSVFAGLGSLKGQSAAAGGSLQPVTVLSVTDASGQRLLEPGPPESRSVLSPQLAYLVHNILSDEPARWPSLGYPNPLEVGRPAGAKIGTADGGREVWAAGYTRQMTAVTWIGLPVSQGNADTSSGQRLDPNAAAGLWHALIQYTHRDLAPADWDQPPGISKVEVCDPSGLLPTSTCPTHVSEIFLNGNEPTGPDTLYTSVEINRETGLLATVFTPPELVEDHTYMILPPEAQAWGRQAGLPVPPSDYDRIQPPTPLPGVEISQPALFAYVHGKLTLRGTAGGSSFSSYRLQAGAGLNPTEWLQIGVGDQPVQAGALGQWDTQGQNGLFAVRLQVVRTNQQIETAIIQVTVDNIPPVVQILSPQPAERISSSGSAVLFQVDATDNVGIQKVEYNLDGRLLGEASEAPFSLAWQSLSPGSHTLEAVAYDLAGNLTESAPVEFVIN